MHTNCFCFGTVLLSSFPEPDQDKMRGLRESAAQPRARHEAMTLRGTIPGISGTDRPQIHRRPMTSSYCRNEVGRVRDIFLKPEGTP
ncbi:hypothetical protein BDM02DRAFT_1547850 [Thelephora ganbajun]|uniref:Uncharacterized protein n=1 Tax=Thelephora ganbajun TaxID=370292 RepID=A0ACB6Z182_THEGA|nr:hypothetical protein BDM02DRAFT_1547850 [Thelephora ganbajun]